MKELIGYQLVTQFISASVSGLFFFFKKERRKLHAVLQKEDNYILPLGETTKMASANTPSAGGKAASQQPGPAACGSSQPTQHCKTYSFNIRPVSLLSKNT